MDELEIRRRLWADPNTTVSPLSPQDAQLQTELQAIDQQLKAAMHIKVPEHLPERVLFNQPRRNYRQLAMAATFAVLSVVGMQWYNIANRADNIGAQALNHVYHELAALQSSGQIPTATVNALLAELGGTITDERLAVRYAKFCDFEGTRSLHLVFANDQGLVTVFIVPKNHGLQESPVFSDRQFFGKSQQLASTNIVMVASQQQLLDPFAQMLLSKLQFQS